MQHQRPAREQKRKLARADYRADKKLLRLPSPFYRTPDMKIVPGPGAEQIVFSFFRVEHFVHDEAIGTSHIVRGWLVQRTNTLEGYYIDMSIGFETLTKVNLNPTEEGTLWTRGWNDEAFASVCAATAMA